MRMPLVATLQAGNISVDLRDKQRHYLRQNGFSVTSETDAATVTAEIVVKGADHSERTDNLNRIQAVLDECIRRRRQGHIGGELYLSLNTDHAVRYYVQSGELAVQEYVGGSATTVAFAVLTLECLPTAYGDPIDVPEQGPFTNGDGQLVVIRDVPGTTDGLLRLWIRDDSDNGAVINRLRIGRVSGHDLNINDYPGYAPFIASGSGFSDEDETDYINDQFARANTSSSWSQFATMQRPSDWPDVGTVNVLPRIRSEVPFLSAPEIGTAEFSLGISLRQSASGSTSSTSATVTATYPNETQEGNLLIAVHFIGRAGEFYPASAQPTSMPSGWVLVERLFSSGSGETCIELWMYENNPGGITSVTHTSGTSIITSNHWLVVNEFRGVKTSGALDDSAQNADSGTSHSTGTTDTISQANTLAIAAHILNNTGTARTPEAGWEAIHSSSSSNSVYTRVIDTIATVEHTMTTTVSRSSRNVIATFSGIESTAAEMPSGGYQVWIQPYDQGEATGPASSPANVTLPTTGGISLEWSPSSGAAGYYVFWRRDSNDLRYIDAGNVTSYILTTESGSTVGPILQTQESGFIRADIGVGTSGEVITRGQPIMLDIGNSEWHAVNIGALPLPMMPSMVDADSESWRIDLFARHPAGSWAIDADVCWLFPHGEPQMQLTYVDSDGIAMRDDERGVWRFDVRPDGRSSAVMLDRDTLEMRGHVRRDGRLRLRPGDNYFLIVADRQEGINDVEDIAFSAWAEITPGFSGATGGRGRF